MVKALAESGLAEYEPYSGVRLTAAGEKLAGLVLRRHRLVELFLVQVMGMSWAEVHDEAEQLEHVVSERLIERIDEMLGRPTHDPHGDPIPDPEGAITRRDLDTLMTCPVGIPLRVTRIADQDPAFLRFIESNDLKPGQAIEVETRDAAADSVRLRGRAPQDDHDRHARRVEAAGRNRPKLAAKLRLRRQVAPLRCGSISLAPAHAGRPAVLHQLQRAEIEVQILGGETELLADLLDGLFELHERQTDGFGLLARQRFLLRSAESPDAPSTCAGTPRSSARAVQPIAARRRSPDSNGDPRPSGQPSTRGVAPNGRPGRWCRRGRPAACAARSRGAARAIPRPSPLVAHRQPAVPSSSTGVCAACVRRCVMAGSGGQSAAVPFGDAASGAARAGMIRSAAQKIDDSRR